MSVGAVDSPLDYIPTAEQLSWIGSLLPIGGKRVKRDKAEAINTVATPFQVSSVQSSLRRCPE